MATKISNPCYRCGKERIKAKTWNEKVTNFMGTSVITYTQTVCPDPECQKIVEKELAAQKKKKEAFELDKENRKAAFKASNKKRSIDLKNSRKQYKHK
ncbi:MAG: hypothetical protein A2857_06920 [Candidatus Levybacteria bacterium RIFCSPHIGHO2_01_FULL_36_15]|nr:MAG: hypothetical protein A2857_06920 [Candidatus Levybacteria bacterium RIFCSPHIGHO2_01_FULL_36_15]OGH38655.1 MAG: hypothetical protein A2905_04195 [Candidatus Levybacteria bacterium RIFCSPLOWO2_01_FULL_36_10]